MVKVIGPQGGFSSMEQMMRPGRNRSPQFKAKVTAVFDKGAAGEIAEAARKGLHAGDHFEPLEP